MTADLDQYVQRLQNIQTFNIYSISEKGQVKPWYEVSGDIVKDLVIHPANLAEQVEAVSVQIQHWGRMAAQAKRVWEIVEREFRMWRATFYLERATPPPDEPKWKKPSDTFIDHQLRIEPMYQKHYRESERAEEAYNSALAVLDGFRAKKDMLKMAVIRSHEDGAARLSV